MTLDVIALLVASAAALALLVMLRSMAAAARDLKAQLLERSAAVVAARMLVDEAKVSSRDALEAQTLAVAALAEATALATAEHERAESYFRYIDEINHQAERWSGSYHAAVDGFSRTQDALLRECARLSDAGGGPVRPHLAPMVAQFKRVHPVPALPAPADPRAAAPAAVVDTSPVEKHD